MTIKILGSSHISGKYASKISDIILIEEPDIVAVELDYARARSLFEKNKKIPVIDSIKRIGLFGFMFSVIGSKMQSYLGKQVGFEPGIDMKRAIISGKKINAKIVLIDQKIEVIMKQISELKFSEKLKLVLYIFSSPFSKKNRKLSKEMDLSEVPDQKVIDEIIKEFKKHFPQIYKILIADRNKFLAKNLITLQKKYKNAEIIAVIGAGHKKEVEEYIEKYSE